MTLDEIQSLSIVTASPARRNGRSFTEKEAKHILSLLSPKKATYIVLTSGGYDGIDGETFHYFKINKKNGQPPPRKDLKYVYEASIELGWLKFKPNAVQLVKEFRSAGAEVEDGIEVDARTLRAEALAKIA